MKYKEREVVWLLGPPEDEDAEYVLDLPFPVPAIVSRHTDNNVVVMLVDNDLDELTRNVNTKLIAPYTQLPPSLEIGTNLYNSTDLEDVNQAVEVVEEVYKHIEAYWKTNEGS